VNSKGVKNPTSQRKRLNNVRLSASLLGPEVVIFKILPAREELGRGVGRRRLGAPATARRIPPIKVEPKPEIPPHLLTLVSHTANL